MFGNISISRFPFKNSNIASQDYFVLTFFITNPVKKQLKNPRFVMLISEAVFMIRFAFVLQTFFDSWPKDKEVQTG